MPDKKKYVKTDMGLNLFWPVQLVLYQMTIISGKHVTVNKFYFALMYVQ